MKKNILPLIRTENLVVKELPQETLFYDLENNKAFCLNETARLIMGECDGVQTAAAAVLSLQRKLSAEVSEEMIWMVVDQLQRAALVRADYEIPLELTRVSRRKILQAAASLGIALPIVTSLVAPTAAQAQSSCIPGGQPCTSSNGVSSCCPDTGCFNTELGPTGFTCIGCIPLGQPCTPSGTICCQGTCFTDLDGSTCTDPANLPA